MEDTCNSCKEMVANDKGTITFSCPSCKEKITRCSHCRSIGAKYVCLCSFTGPN